LSITGQDRASERRRRASLPRAHFRAERFESISDARPADAEFSALVPPRGRLKIRLVAKRDFDLVFAVVAVVLLSPLLLAIAVAILVSEGRPVLYRQQRVGRYGAPFTMLKFRSMVADAHDRLHELQERNERTGPLFKIHKDPRVTRVGKFLRFTSLDELPQLFNVLGGTMSMVGPRPALYEERESFPPALLEREVLRPGITGLWQVEARSDPDFDRYHQLDLVYVQNRTLWLDVKLLVRTPIVILRELFRRLSHRAPGAVPAVARVDPPFVHRER
jgi:lipopolysaccharide/colanic/teichoic acid biosynthesis glycosyltransferase